jgi:hypothetical protein
MINDLGFNSRFRRSIKGAGTRVVGDNDCDLSIQATIQAAVNNCLQVRSATRGQYTYTQLL